MRKQSNIMLIIMLIAAVGCLATAGYLRYDLYQKSQPEASVSVLEASPQPMPEVQLADLPESPLKKSKMDLVNLTSDNSVVLDQAFDDESVTAVMLDLQRISEKLPKNAIIYLVLNTPGGSVTAGQSLLSFAKALPQEVKTLTIFSASMGFQTVQGLGERLILDTGSLMSHRAKFGVNGQGPGELFSRLRWIMSMIDALDVVASARMGITLDEYRKLIYDEYWAFGNQAVKDKSADRVVLARCDASLKGTKSSSVQTPFGMVSVERSRCPLMPGILGVSMSENVADTNNAAAFARSMFLDRTSFLREHVVTGYYNR